MNRKRRDPPTELNAYDRKILEKHTGFFTNMLAGNAAETKLFENKPDIRIE